jgi:hypothetical protein
MTKTIVTAVIVTEDSTVGFSTCVAEDGSLE